MVGLRAVNMRLHGCCNADLANSSYNALKPFVTRSTSTTRRLLIWERINGDFALFQ